MKDILKKAIDTSQRAQRNYDLTRSVPAQDLETLVYAATNSPSKQNETHYALYVYTDQNMIRKIYNETKLFSLIKDKEDFINTFKEEDGKFWQNEDLSVHNSQVLANILCIFAEDHGQARGGNSIIAQNTTDITTESYQIYQEQINYSIGIAVGELILSAALLGYKTGLCSAFPKDKMKKIVGSKYNPRLIVGIGYENAGTDRRLHAETLNKDVPEKFRTGKLEEQWRFPSFEKEVSVFLNGKERKKYKPSPK